MSVDKNYTTGAKLAGLKRHIDRLEKQTKTADQSIEKVTEATPTTSDAGVGGSTLAGIATGAATKLKISGNPVARTVGANLVPCYALYSKWQNENAKEDVELGLGAVLNSAKYQNAMNRAGIVIKDLNQSGKQDLSMEVVKAISDTMRKGEDAGFLEEKLRAAGLDDNNIGKLKGSFLELVEADEYKNHKKFVENGVKLAAANSVEHFKNSKIIYENITMLKNHLESNKLDSGEKVLNALSAIPGLGWALKQLFDSVSYASLKDDINLMTKICQTMQMAAMQEELLAAKAIGRGIEARAHILGIGIRGKDGVFSSDRVGGVLTSDIMKYMSSDEELVDKTSNDSKLYNPEIGKVSPGSTEVAKPLDASAEKPVVAAAAAAAFTASPAPAAKRGPSQKLAISVNEIMTDDMDGDLKDPATPPAKSPAAPLTGLELQNADQIGPPVQTPAQGQGQGLGLGH